MVILITAGTTLYALELNISHDGRRLSPKSRGRVQTGQRTGHRSGKQRAVEYENLNSHELYNFDAKSKAVTTEEQSMRVCNDVASWDEITALAIVTD